MAIVTGRTKKGNFNVEVDTKRLDQIIRQTRPADSWTISDGVDYGVYVEFGTYKMPARPAAVPAATRIREELPGNVKEALVRGVDLDDVIRKSAFDLEALWKQNFFTHPKPPIDTGAYRDSINAEPDK